VLRRHPFDAQLDQVAKADTVAFGGVGIAGTMSPATQAYFALEEAIRQPGTQLRKRLEALLDTATPAGRIYAGELLTHVSAEAGRAAWTRLARQDLDVSTMTGCVMGRTTVARYAAERLHAT
jgi:hypothetical protein